MGNYIRDFRGNELEWLEEEEASDSLVGRIDDYIARWKDEASDLRDLASNAEDLVSELEELRDAKQEELDEQEEECLYCSNTASEFGDLCDDCNRNEEAAARDGW